MAGRLGRLRGGILGLILLIGEHRAAFDYDWRSRFHLPADSIGREMPWDEAVRLTRLMRADPSTHIAAAVEKWEHPVTREALILMDVFDLEHAVNSKKTPKPHPGRPWKDKGAKRRMGNTGGRTPDEVRALLAAAREGRPLSLGA